MLYKMKSLDGNALDPEDLNLVTIEFKKEEGSTTTGLLKLIIGFKTGARNYEVGFSEINLIDFPDWRKAPIVEKYKKVRDDIIDEANLAVIMEQNARVAENKPQEEGPCP